MTRYKPRWIDPADELPQDGQVVLVESGSFGVTCARFVADCDYATEGFRWSSPGFATFGPIYRWCAVPPFPEPKRYRPWLHFTKRLFRC